MAPMTCPQRRAYQAKQRRLQKARQRLQHEQARAQRHLQALQQALGDWGLPELLAAEVQWRLNAITQVLDKIFGMMFPPLFGCRSYHERCRVRGWDKNLPGRLLGALPKRQGVKQLQRRGQALLARLWQPIEDKSPATRSRWQWTWVGDDSMFKQDGQQLGLVGIWYSGQEQRVRLGIDGLRLIVVSGDGKLVIPVDFTGRRPDPEGPGRDTLTWLQVMLDRTWAALQRRRLPLPPPLVVADSWFAGSGWLAHVALHAQGTLVVEGQRTYVFERPDKGRVTGEAFLTRADWPWRDYLNRPGVRYARLRATSPT